MRTWLLKAVILLIAAIIIYQWISKLAFVFLESDVETIRQHFYDMGWMGMISLFFLQAIQVFLSFLPAFPIQIAFGMAYGLLVGTLLCFISYALTNLFFFLYLKRRYTPQEIEQKVHKKLRWFSFLLNMNHKNHLIILLYLIPLVPNILKPYISCYTQVSTKQYLILLTTSLVPIFASVFIGTALVYQWYHIAFYVSIFCSVGTLMIGIWLYYHDCR
ncbi:MAG: VTT domain-containing protein [Erysipelotrichaceae bacterium]|nr:VTT domain-containing protein [Erysipelotrichaceae bacterium]